MKVYCGCKKCGGDAEKCFGDMYPGVYFEPIKSPETPQADVTLNDLLCCPFCGEEWQKNKYKDVLEFDGHYFTVQLVACTNCGRVNDKDSYIE